MRTVKRFKGTKCCLESRLSFSAHVILLDPKKITSFIVDVMEAHDKESEECCADVQVLGGRVTFVSSYDETHMRHG